MTGCTILAVFAHPDDESLACGGTLARAADAGARVILLCASRGERGFISDPALVPDGDLGGVRTRELNEAANVLGVAEVLVFSHPDGNLRWADVPEFHAEIARAIRDYQPDAVITFAEDGLYWHPDHIGVHERTCAAVRSFGDAAPSLYYVTMPKGVMRGLVESAIATGWVPPNSGPWSIAPDAFGVLTGTPSFIVDVREWVVRKLAALRCHHTQMDAGNPFASLDLAEARRWLGAEHFRRAWLHPGRSVLEQLGEPVAGSNEPQRR